MIPQQVHGNPVRFVARVDSPRFPRGYPGDGPLEKTAAFLISVSDHEGDDECHFWVTCLGITGRLMAGDLCYSLESAMEFPPTEFYLEDLTWIALTDPQPTQNEETEPSRRC